jgi:cysteine-S-conjugate beta-lyase
VRPGTVRTAAGVELPTVDELVARGSAKWTRDPGALGASVAEMDFGLAPETVEAVAGSARRAALGYLPPPLSRTLAEATARLQDAEFGWRVPADRVVAVGDVIVGLETVIEHFTEPGSPVVVLTPAYMPFLTVPRRLGRSVVEVPLRCTAPGSWELDPEQLDAALRSGAGLVVLCNPHNPLGKVYRPDELTTVAGVVERHGARVFADEIHGLPTYPGHVHRPYADLTAETARHVVTATSASKSWNIPGLKCAQLILAEEDGPAWAAARHSASRGASNPGAEARPHEPERKSSWTAIRTAAATSASAENCRSPRPRAAPRVTRASESHESHPCCVVPAFRIRGASRVPGHGIGRGREQRRQFGSARRGGLPPRRAAGRGVWLVRNSPSDTSSSHPSLHSGAVLSSRPPQSSTRALKRAAPKCRLALVRARRVRSPGDRLRQTPLVGRRQARFGGVAAVDRWPIVGGPAFPDAGGWPAPRRRSPGVRGSGSRLGGATSAPPPRGPSPDRSTGCGTAAAAGRAGHPRGGVRGSTRPAPDQGSP